MQKRFYSVKETAKILGVSTNTVYKSLDEGSLKGKRIQKRGKFKIPFSEVAPYLAGEPPAKASEETPAVKQEDQKARGKLNVFGSLLGALFIGLFLLFLLGNFGQGAVGFQSSLTRNIGASILGYSDRTFSGFGSLVSRFLPEAQQLASQTQPPNEIVSNSSTQIVPEEKTPDLSYKIENTEGRTNELYANAQVLASSTQRLLSKRRTLKSATLSINVLPKIDEVVFLGLSGPKDESELKNSLLSVKGVLTANKTHLVQKAGETVVVTWPEWDGAAYKILIIN